MLISFIITIITLSLAIPYFVLYQTKWLLKVKIYKGLELKPLDTKGLNKELEPFGFAYNEYHDYFYSLLHPWQREFGYGKIYDDTAPYISLIFDYENIYFEYDNKMWLIEFWKGQYGMTTGGEIGIYKTDLTDDYENVIFECVSDYELLPMYFNLKKSSHTLIIRDDLHWWLTGFKLGEFSKPNDLLMEISISFNSSEMLKAFINALDKINYKELKITDNSVSLIFNHPHQKNFKPKIISYIMQKLNKEYCTIYNNLTKDYDNALDKINHLRSYLPGFYNIMLEILKNRQNSIKNNNHRRVFNDDFQKIN